MVAKTREKSGDILIRNGAIGLAGLLGVGVLIWFIFDHSYNYDELSHAHMAWLVSVGEVPYRDFAANHFPFLWILLSPLMWVLPHTPFALVVLRILALMLNAVFIAALCVLIGVEQQPKERIWTVVCIGVVAFYPLSMDYLIEFRPDPFANALLFSTLAWLRLRNSRSVPTALIGGFCIGVAFLVNTKYIPFIFLLGPVALAMNVGQLRRILPFALAIGLGFSMAFLVGALLLVSIGASLDDAWRMVVIYNGMAENARPFGFGMLGMLLENPVWFAYGLAGLVGCTILFLHQRRSPGPLIVTMGIFLVTDLFMTTKPYKQYAVSWLLLAACLQARLLPPFIARLRLPIQAVLALGVLAIVGIGFAQTEIEGPDDSGMDRATQDRVMRWFSQNVPPDGFVVSGFYVHPVFWRDSFFKTVYDTAPGYGDGLEEFIPRLTTVPFAEHFQPAGYEKDLELRPPAAIVLNNDLNKENTRDQVQALNAYLDRHADVYEEYTIPGTPISVAVADRN